jgi:hypothetical protein
MAVPPKSNHQKFKKSRQSSKIQKVKAIPLLKFQKIKAIRQGKIQKLKAIMSCQ